MLVSPGVYRAEVVRDSDIDTLKAACLASSLLRARICLHAADDSPVQDMILVMARDSVVPIHRHDEYETITILEGEVEVVVFEDDYHETVVHRLGCGMRSARVGGKYHKVIVKSDIAVIHEVKHGTFKQMILK